MKKEPGHKTRYVAYVAASADGRISLREKTLPDWTSKEDWKHFQNALARADAVVVGRNTYESAKTRLRKRTTFVLSTRPRNVACRGSVTFVNPDRMDLRDLLIDYRTVAILGGSAVYGFMLRHGLFDELFLTLEPFVFGRGKSMFSGLNRTKRLDLVSIKHLNRTGTLLLHYRIRSYTHAHTSNTYPHL